MLKQFCINVVLFVLVDDTSGWSVASDEDDDEECDDDDEDSEKREEEESQEVGMEFLVDRDTEGPPPQKVQIAGVWRVACGGPLLMMNTSL